MTSLLNIDRLSVRLPRGADREWAIHKLTLSVNAGEIVCVVGESGSGKSTLANAILRLLGDDVVPESGRIMLGDIDLLSLGDEALREIRGQRIAMIFQEPMTALNPLRTVGDQIGEMFRAHTSLSSTQIAERVSALLGEVGLVSSRSMLSSYPHQLSGGQRQRVMIAMALALEPSLLIADEPTTALDVTTQKQILALIRDIQQRKGMGVLFITHDFGVVAEIADRVVVMRHGERVESGPASTVLTAPEHPYTQGLLAAVPHGRINEHSVVEAGAEVLPPLALVARNVNKTYKPRNLFAVGRHTRALNEVSFELRRGRTLGVIGESGSGKSTLARCLMRLESLDSGTIQLGGSDYASLSASAWRKQSHRIQMVFQDPFGSLNPRRRVGDLVAQGLITHGMSRAAARVRAVELLEMVGLQASAADRYPHEFSGGQRQRIGLARAVALEPEVLVADEPVSALDVSVQAQILELLAELRTRLQLSVLIITHDLRVAAQICDDIVVMQAGKVVERGTVTEVLQRPSHPYTRALMAALPGAVSIPIVSPSVEHSAFSLEA
jgi:peptide/nickel transport system ATP-binding protein